MAKPPKLPIKFDNKGMDYFDYLVSMVEPYFNEFQIPLDFTGYKELVDMYGNLTNENTELAWNLSKEINIWSEYISDLSNLTQKLFLDSETDKIEQFAIASYQADKVKVANGERLANKDLSVVNVRKRRNSFKAFSLALESKNRFLERAYHHCKSTCNWNYSSNYDNSSNNEMLIKAIEKMTELLEKIENVNYSYNKNLKLV